jgi:hypothetical protein
MFRGAYQRLRRATIRTAVNTTLFIGALEVTTHLPSQGRSSDAYHHLCDEWVTPFLRRFLDPECTYDYVHVHVHVHETLRHGTVLPIYS